MFEHYIFDFDGTISDTYPIFLKIFHDISKERRLPFPLNDETLLNALKINVKTGFEAMGWRDYYGEYLNFIKGDFHIHHIKNVPNLYPFPEAVELLKTLHKRGKKLYIYTHSGKLVHDALKNMGLYDLFTFILDSSYQFPSKPSPEALLFFLKKIGCSPLECLMIGDRYIDAQAGMNAGMKGCLWDTAKLYTDCKVDYRVDSLTDILKI